MLSDLRVAPRPSFQSIPLTVMVMSPTGELLLGIVMEYTVLTFKFGGGVEVDKEQLRAISWLVITRPAQRSRGQILEPIPVEQQIEVCPGDVIGFYVQNTTRGNGGVQLQQQDNDDEEEDEDEGEDSSSNISFRRHVVVTAWYGSVSTSVAATGSCMLRVGRNNGYDLRSSTTAAPIITASVAVFTPPPSETLSPSTSTLPSSLPESALVTTSTPLLVITQTGTSQRTEILQALTQFSTLSTPQPSPILSPSLLSGELELELGVMVPTVIVVLIVVVLGVLIVVFILTMARRRMAKKQMAVKSLNNSEYSGT